VLNINDWVYLVEYGFITLVISIFMLVRVEG